EKKVEKLVFDYVMTGNTAYLDSSYVKLNKEKYFQDKKLDSSNIDLIYQIYFMTERYDELASLLDSSALDSKTKNYLSHLCYAYSNYQSGDVKEAQKYIRENMEIKRREINKNLSDSIAVMEYYFMKAHLKDKGELFREIDSIKLLREKPSDIFYDEILKSELTDYYIEFPDFLK